MGKTTLLLVVFVFVCPAFGDSAAERVAAGNALYGKASFDEAIGEYDKAVEVDPKAFEAMFNKGASLFRKGDVNKAIELFQDVAAGAGDKELVEKAKYNLGNSYYRRGRETSEQQEPDMEKAMADYKASVKNWRQVLDMDKSNASAKRNVEIAKAAIQKLKEQQQQQQQQQQGEDKQEDKEKQDQQQDQQQQGDQEQEEKEQQQDQQQGDEQQEQQEQQQQQGEEEDKKDERQKALDALAEDILKKEKEDHKKRQMLLLKREPVEKDW